MLAPGRAVLARVREDEPGALDEALADPVLRAGVVRAAQYDRRDGDLPLLRLLLERETSERTEWYTERWIAAMLVALHGEEEDLPLVRAATDGQAAGAEGARDWARAMDADRYGRDPETESAFTWIELAHAQGRIEHTRVALIRLLDDAGPADAELLGRLSEALERLGDHAQAARAQFFFLSSRTPTATARRRPRSWPGWSAARVISPRHDVRWSGRVRRWGPCPSGTVKVSAA